jgi:hypothetical protein
MRFLCVLSSFLFHARLRGSGGAGCRSFVVAGFLKDGMMPKLKLTYFDMHGGRGEPVRLALTLGGMFEDHRFAYPQFAEIRKTVPFGQVPVLEVDGVQTNRCDSALRG